MSTFTRQPPALWYESPLVDGKLNSSSPQAVSLKLCANSRALLGRIAASARSNTVEDVEAALKSAILVVALRFDGQPIEVFDRARHAMVQCPPRAFSIENVWQWTSLAEPSSEGGRRQRRRVATASGVRLGVVDVGGAGTLERLTLLIERKLPLSTSVSGAPLRLCVAIGDDDVALSHPFESLSRQSASGGCKPKRAAAPSECTTPEVQARLRRVYATCLQLQAARTAHDDEDDDVSDDATDKEEESHDEDDGCYAPSSQRLTRRCKPALSRSASPLGVGIEVGGESVAWPQLLPELYGSSGIDEAPAEEDLLCLFADSAACSPEELH